MKNATPKRITAAEKHAKRQSHKIAIRASQLKIVSELKDTIHKSSTLLFVQVVKGNTRKLSEYKVFAPTVISGEFKNVELGNHLNRIDALRGFDWEYSNSNYSGTSPEYITELISSLLFDNSTLLKFEVIDIDLASKE